MSNYKKYLNVVSVCCFFLLLAMPMLAETKTSEKESKTTVDPQQSKQKKKETETIEISVKGMVCSFCAQGIKKAFDKKKEVKDVKVNLKEKLVTIVLNNDHVLTDKTIQAIIKDAGYNIKQIKRTPVVAKKMKTVKVGGMTCVSCVNKITTIFLEKASVERVVFLSELKSFELYIKKNHTLSHADISSSLKKAGYEALEIR